MTTPRTRAIALLDELTGGTMQQSCIAFMDTVPDHALTEWARRAEEHCIVHPLSSRTCERRTRSCDVKHSDPAAPPSSEEREAAAPTPTEEGRRWWIVTGNNGRLSVCDSYDAAVRQSSTIHRIDEVVPASRAESASRDRDAAVARAEAAEQSAEREKEANLDERAVWSATMRQLGWTNNTYGLDDIVCVVERTLATCEAAEARVRDLEAELKKQRASLLESAGAAGVAAIDAAREQAAADMRDRAAEFASDKLIACRPYLVVSGIRSLPLRPAAPTADDGDEKEKTND